MTGTTFYNIFNISNNCCSFELSIHQRILKRHAPVSAKKKNIKQQNILLFIKILE